MSHGAICAKNSTFGYFDGTNLITGEGIQLQSQSYHDNGSWLSKELVFGVDDYHPPFYSFSPRIVRL